MTNHYYEKGVEKIVYECSEEQANPTDFSNSADYYSDDRVIAVWNYASMRG